jgi:glucose/arabinose dehydrogenase
MNFMHFRIRPAVLALVSAATLLPRAAIAELPKNVTFTPFITGTATASLNKPIYFAEIPGKPGRYVVLEQHLGRISVFTRPAGAAEWTKTLLDTVTIPSSVTSRNEMGLLGMAFHPNFAVNRKYYLYYNPSYSASTGARTLVVERQTDSTLLQRNLAIPSRAILDFPSGPYDNHKAGTIHFGPTDGYLYVAVGDGGGSAAYRFGNDSAGRSQNPDSLLGKFLRIDVDHPAGGKEYGIPADNPFVGGGHAEEVYALGARNPFKWSFDLDPATGKANIWLGNVGQDSIEAVTLVPKGANLGWRVVESPICNAFYGSTCNKTGFTMPVYSYRHLGGGDSTGKCIIGGYVFRGNPASPFYGAYFFGDLSTARVWAIRTDGVGTLERVTLGVVPGAGAEQLTSFGRDHAGNLYLVARGGTSSTSTNGIIYSLASPDLVAMALTPSRRARALAPVSARDLTGLSLRDLRGRGVSGSPSSGLYFTRRPADRLPALVPVLDAN